MKNKKNIPIDFINNTFDRKFKLGTRYINEIGSVFKYCKFDFGPVGKDSKTKKIYRHIEYGWVCIR